MTAQQHDMQARMDQQATLLQDVRSNLRQSTSQSTPPDSPRTFQNRKRSLQSMGYRKQALSNQYLDTVSGEELT